MAPFPFDEILVPLDGSAAAERALVPALELARRSGEPIRVLSRVLGDGRAAGVDVHGTYTGGSPAGTGR